MILAVIVVALAAALVVRDVRNARRTSREGVFCGICRGRTGAPTFVEHYLKEHDS